MTVVAAAAVTSAHERTYNCTTNRLSYISRASGSTMKYRRPDSKCERSKLLVKLFAAGETYICMPIFFYADCGIFPLELQVSAKSGSNLDMFPAQRRHYAPIATFAAPRFAFPTRHLYVIRSPRNSCRGPEVCREGKTVPELPGHRDELMQRGPTSL